MRGLPRTARDAPHLATEERGHPVPLVYAVHATNVQAVGAMSAIFNDLCMAEKYALGRSSDYGVICSSVTSFELNKLGTRRCVSWFQDGEKQPGGLPEPHHHLRPLHSTTR